MRPLSAVGCSSIDSRHFAALSNSDPANQGLPAALHLGPGLDGERPLRTQLTARIACAEIVAARHASSLGADNTKVLRFALCGRSLAYILKLAQVRGRLVSWSPALIERLNPPVVLPSRATAPHAATRPSR